MTIHRIFLITLGLILVTGLVSSLAIAEEAPEAAALKSLEWRSIGPANMSGRITDIDGVPGDPMTFFVAGADGGLWKTTNTGTTFEPLFEDQPVYSVGGDRTQEETPPSQGMHHRFVQIGAVNKGTPRISNWSSLHGLLFRHILQGF